MQSLGRRDAQNVGIGAFIRCCRSQTINSAQRSPFSNVRQSQLPCHFEILAMCSPRGSSKTLCSAELSRTKPATAGKQGSAEEYGTLLIFLTFCWASQHQSDSALVC